MEMEIVYKAAPESLQMVMELMRKEGLNPTTLENPSNAAVLSGAGKATYLINVTVPREEATAAKSILRKWDETRQTEVEKTARRLLGSFLLTIPIVTLVAVLLLFLGNFSDFVALLFVIWIVVFALAANMDRIMQKVRGRKT